MKTKITVSLLVMALVCCLVGGATFAFFTDSAINEANTFATGEFDVSILDDTNNTSTVIIPDPFAPGDSITGSFVIKNSGDYNMWYEVVASETGDIFAVDPSLFTVTYNGLPADWATLAPGAEVTISYEVKLDLTAGNEFENKTGTVGFTVNAEQYKNRDAAH